MASSYQADAATEALIAQLMAEDFGEVYADHIRPIGSHAGDYEEPLTSYERQCLENPDMEDGEGGWNPPTPKIDPVEGPTLAEGESWDSSINEDPRIESTPTFMSSRNGESVVDDSKGSVEPEDSVQEVQDTLDHHSELGEPPHHIQDPLGYHADAPTQSLTRHASLPVQELVSPTRDDRRVISDPSRLEDTADELQKDPSSPILSEPPQPQQPGPSPLSPNCLAPKSPIASNIPPLSNPFAPTIATNERLLNLINDTSDSNLDQSSCLNAPEAFSLDLESFGNFNSNIDASSAKNKGKAPVEDAATDPNNRMHDYMDRYKNTVLSRRDSEIDYSKTKGKGKAGEGSDDWDQFKDYVPYVGRKANLASDSLDAVVDKGIHGDGSFDEETGMPFLCIPWPDSSRRDREFRDAMDAQVHEIWVGEKETVESILRDIREREEIMERPWGSWGVDDDGRVGVWEEEKGKGKGKGKTVEC